MTETLTPPTVTAGALIAQVRDLAYRFPHATYPSLGGSCLYTRGQAGPGAGCINGQGLIGCDPSLRPQLEELDRGGMASIEAVLEYLGIPGTAEELRWLDEVQGFQDLGAEWADAVLQADRAAAVRRAQGRG